MKRNDKERQEINAMLRDLQDIKSDLDKAQQAKVPRVDELLDKCKDAEDKLICFKQAFYPGKP